MSLNDPPLLRARLFSPVETRDAVASGDARGSGSFPGRRGSEEVVSVDLGVMPRGLRVAAARVRRARRARWQRQRDAWLRSPRHGAAGHADAIATLMRRTLTRTRAPIFSSFRRMVPQ